MAEPQRSTTAFAKTTRPETGAVVLRESLNALLDGTPARRIAWIWGAPGTGKSTLAASYVDAREARCAWYQIDPDDEDVATFFHYLGLAARRIGVEPDALPRYGTHGAKDPDAFSRRFFRTLFAGAAPSSVLVLDNLHALPEASALHAVLEAGLSQVPRHCLVIVTSRAEPVGAWSRLRASGELVCLGGDALRITPGELAGIAALRGIPLAREALEAMQARAQGWAAALVLMLEHARIAGRLAEPPQDATPAVVFDYLAGEIFDRFEPATRRFLLRIACLPRMTAEVAQALSGEAMAARLLRNFVHNDYFVREVVEGGHHVFALHPLMRSFLLARAEEELPEAVGADARRRGAQRLYAAGQIEDAVQLQIESEDWAGVAAIVAEQADALLSQGRRSTVAAWIEALPAQVLAGDATLLCCLASCRLPESARTARHRFEQAHALARASGDDLRRRAACCGVIAATIREFDDLSSLDRWMPELAALLHAEGGTGDADAIEALACASLLRDPARAGDWVTRVLPRSRAGARPALLGRLTAALLRGDFAGVVERPVHTSPPDVALLAGDALLCLLEGAPRRALDQARAGLDVVEGDAREAAWLHLLIAASALTLGERETARQALGTLEATELRRGDRALLQHLQGRLATLQGDDAAALRHARSALSLAVESGLPWVEALVRLDLAPLLRRSGDTRAADLHVRAASDFAVRLDSVLLRIAVECLQAAMAVEAGDDTLAQARLAQGFGLVRERGLRNIVGLPPSVLSSLCALSLQHDIEPDVARTLIRNGRLLPDAAGARLAQWPWRYRIRAFGGFALERDGNAIEFSAKGPGRPVELLKVIVALGGTQVRVEHLMDALWPNVDADYAYGSFTATLHRLRRIFGDDDVVVLRDGRVSLDRSLVWLDTWALDDLVAALEADLRTPEAGVAASTARDFIDAALGLYRGAFLDDADDQVAYLAKREQVRTRLGRHVSRLARVLEDGGHAEAALDCHFRCIDADALYEAFHRSLMACQLRQGDRAGAIAAYERLRTLLAASARRPPSDETDALYVTLRP